MKIDLPYGDGGIKTIDIPTGLLLDILSPPEIPGLEDEAQTVKSALQNPLGTKKISEIAFSDAKVAIAVSDASRPNVEKKVVPYLLEELYVAGVRDENIVILIGTGSHRETTPKEIEDMLGQEIPQKIKVMSHNSSSSPVTFLGYTGGGFPAEVNQLFAEADVKIALGTVLPHPFAGYSGGGKAVAIGVGSDRSIASTHVPKILDDVNTGIGVVKNNPFIQFTYEVCDLVKLDFSINCVVNEKQELVGIKCGDYRQVHQKLIDEVARKVFEAPFNAPADVVVVSVGYPKDTNFYHICAEGICVATGQAVQYPVVKKGGTIIIVSPIQEGIYNHNFFNRLAQGKTPQEVLEITGKEGISAPGHHRAYAVAKILTEHDVIIAGSHMERDLIEKVHMIPADDVNEAIQYCYSKQGYDLQVSVLRNSYRLVPSLFAV